MSFLYEQSNNKNVKVENAERGIYNFVFYKIILKSKSADQFDSYFCDAELAKV